MARFAFNPYRQDLPRWEAPDLGFTALIRERAALALHRALPGYAPTPLVRAPAAAAAAGVGEVLVKDESGRFGIDAFKGLGASFAMYTVLRRRWADLTGDDLEPTAFRDPTVRARLGAVTFTAATDGNHGRAVAWTARMLGQRAVIFMPTCTAAARIAHIEREGATVHLLPGTFDDCVTTCARTAAAEGWQVIADTAYPGNMDLPGFIMAGYGTIFAEIADAGGFDVDAIFLPAGVGGLAAAGAVSCVQQRGAARPRLVCVEPLSSACFLESIERGGGASEAATGDQQSIMVGLCCGVPSLLAWPVVRDTMDLFLAIEDEPARDAMRVYHRDGIISGESGAAALAGLLALQERGDLAPARARLGLGPGSRVLVINTEGATDPQYHQRVIAEAI